MKNDAIIIRKYYNSLDNESKKILRTRFLEQSGLCQTSFYNKMNRWSFTPLELALLKHLVEL